MKKRNTKFITTVSLQEYMEGSRIVWLELKQKGEVTARYNKEWIIDPRNKSSERTIDLLLARFA